MRAGDELGPADELSGRFLSKFNSFFYLNEMYLKSKNMFLQLPFAFITLNDQFHEHFYRLYKSQLYPCYINLPV